MKSVTRRSLLHAAMFAGTSLTLTMTATGSYAVENPGRRIQVLPNGSPALNLGFSVNSGILWESASARTQSFDLMQAIGVTNIRVDIPWRWIEQKRGTFQWALIDPVINAAKAYGFSVLAVLTSTPSWAALGGSTNQQTRPANMRHWGEFVKRVATRYSGKILAYEIWNEPNGVEYFSPAPDPAAYAEMVRTALPHIRLADPSAQVIAGALGPAPAGLSGTMPAIEFFEAMLAAGVGDVDAYSFHPYDNDQTMAQGTYWDNTSMRQMMRMHEILRDRGEGHKKIWATEYGAPSTLLGEARQAELVSSGILQWRECSFAGPMYIHHLRDQSSQDSYGVASQVLQPKQAALAVQSVVNQGFPERWEAVAFQQNSDPALGAPVSPVYEYANGFAQEHTNGVRYANGSDWISATTEVGQLLRYNNLLPAAHASGGMQDVILAGGGRVFQSEHGAWLVVGAILEAWTPAIGFPVSEQELVQPTAVVQGFENGTITWSPTAGTQVQFT